MPTLSEIPDIDPSPAASNADLDGGDVWPAFQLDIQSLFADLPQE